MSALNGKVGKWALKWKTVPRGREGSAQVDVEGVGTLEVRWRRDASGIWIEAPKGVFGYEIAAEAGDDGQVTHRMSQRNADGEWAGLKYLQAGDESAAAAAGGAKRRTRVRAQMPGKITRVLVVAGDTVEKGQPLLVMEAMKMENEIRASLSGRVDSVQVSAGQAVETGADLCVLEPA